MRTLDLIECAEFLKIDRSTLLDIVHRGDILGAKIGRAWVFLEDDVVTYLREQAQIQTQKRIEEIRSGSTTTDARVEKAIRKQLCAGDPRRPGRRKKALPVLPEFPASPQAG
ncbi:MULTISPECIES: helix-turn-helix domain-containing protein [unclassified Burkholderia]|uniref:helix-turn-helix domain-containing protein n=1 Tax=unclassified Burkholderia TaxID=2613784 RepID=UPI000F58E516|nr:MULTISPECIES: helix-turn-helix domain-containing protein [unclassified Burkholderia]RQR81470.1 DNA-binding protein [Burkholderia sp. Bp9011]RQR91047.1 DNA-binding protein [Burkholderia sp. Bp9010]RQS75194.1 DNA-binding protein [Burkholderia sp. Bp8977]